MFGLSRLEILTNAIKNACHNELPKYDAAIKQCATKYSGYTEVSKEESLKIASEARRDYLMAVCESIEKTLYVSSPELSSRFKMVVLAPQVAGISDEFDTDYFEKNGISAGVVLAFVYFVMTNKTADNPKVLKMMTMLSHYQNDLMTSVLKKYDGDC